MILAICNFSGVGQTKYKLGVPKSGKYKEVFSTDLEKYGGKTAELNSYNAKKGDIHGRKHYIEVELPAFSTVYIYKRRTGKDLKSND